MPTCQDDRIQGSPEGRQDPAQHIGRRGTAEAGINGAGGSKETFIRRSACASNVCWILRGLHIRTAPQKFMFKKIREKPPFALQETLRKTSFRVSNENYIAKKNVEKTSLF